MKPAEPTFPVRRANGEVQKSPKSEKETVMASIRNKLFGYGSSRKARYARSATLLAWRAGDSQAHNGDGKRSRSIWRFGSTSEDAEEISSMGESPQTKMELDRGCGPFIRAECGPLPMKGMKTAGATIRTSTLTKDRDLSPHRSYEQILRSQEEYLKNLQHEEFLLYGNFDHDCKLLEARASYLKNLQVEEAKLFDVSNNAEISIPLSGEPLKGYGLENHSIHNDQPLEGQERESLNNSKAPIPSSSQNSKGQGSENHSAHNTEPLEGRKRDDYKSESSDLSQTVVDITKLGKGAKSASKLKSLQGPSTPPACPSSQIQKAIIASRPLASTISSSVANVHGNQEDSNLASIREQLHVMDHGRTREESKETRLENRSSLPEECADRPPTEGVPSIDPRYRRLGGHRGVVTDENWGTKKTSEELDVTNQTEDGLAAQERPVAPISHVRQVMAKFEKNLTELDAAIGHVHIQEGKMAEICSRRESRTSPILSRLAQAMGQSTSTGEMEEDLESDLDSDDLSFFDAEEEFSVDGSGLSSFADSVEGSQEDELQHSLPGDPRSMEDALIRAGEQNTEVRRGRPYLASTRSNNFEGLQMPSFTCNVNNEKSQQSWGMALDNSSNCDAEQSRRQVARRRSSGNSAAILSRLSAVASGKSSGELSRDASESGSSSYHVGESKSPNLASRQSVNNNEAISTRLSEIERDEQCSKDLAWSSKLIQEYTQRRPARRDSSHTTILARLSAVAKGEGIEQVPSHYDNNDLQEQLAGREGISSSSSSSHAAIVSMENEETQRSPSQNSSVKTNHGNNVNHQEFTLARRRRSSNSSAILARLASIVGDERTNESTQQSSEGSVANYYNNSGQGVPRTEISAQSNSSTSATLGRYVAVEKSQLSSKLGHPNKCSDERDNLLKASTRLQSSGKRAIIQSRLLDAPKEETGEHILRNMSIVADNSSNDGEELNEIPASRRRSRGEAILSRLSTGMGNKQVLGDQLLKGSARTRTHERNQQHEDPLPGAKDDSIEQPGTSSVPGGCSNHQIQEIRREIGNASSAGCRSETNEIMRSPNLDVEVEQILVVRAQERENTKALDRLRKDSQDRMKDLEELQVPDFDEFAKKQTRARDSIKRIRIVMSKDRAPMKGIQDVVPSEDLVVQEESGSATTIRQRRQTASKKIEVQRTWVALAEEREIAQTLHQLNQENFARRKTR